MGFEEKRNAMLKKLSKIKRDKSIQRRVSAGKQHRTEAGNTYDSTSDISSKKEMKEIIVYGKESFFMRSIIQSLKSTYKISDFDNEEKACDYCLDNSISYVFLDMDEPTDWRLSTDLFTTIKTINRDVIFFLFTKDKLATPVRTLKKQGAHIITKPVSIGDLCKYLS